MSSKSKSRKRLSMGPAPRIALGLVILTALLLMIADLVLGIVPDEASASLSVRKRSAENLATQLSPLAQREDFDLIGRILHAVSGRNPAVLSIAIRKLDGAVPAQTERHAASWVAPRENKATLTSMVVPMR